MRLLADLHIAPRTVEYLKSLGHDVVRVSEVLPPTSSDHEIIACAARNFSAEISVSGQTYPSVILLRLSISRIESVNRVLSNVLPELEEDVENGALVTIEDHRVRRRRLPLSSA